MSLPRYITILGRQPELGLLELESLVGADGVAPFGRQAALVDQALDVDRLGGVLKVGKVVYDGPVTDIRSMPVDMRELPVGDGKTPFAVSVYGMQVATKFVTTVGLELKKRLRERGSVRFVGPVEGTVVTAAQLHHNQVLERGFELLVVVAKRRMVIARTVGVQNIDWYSKRDFDRPARSAKVGMLPPKLAQILVNSTSAPVVVDPFCGTGVVLQEGLLLGREAVGSDVSEEMVAATRVNLDWLASVASSPLLDWKVELQDARTVMLPGDCAVVSEGYLGPNLTHFPTGPELGVMRNELLALYRECLTDWAAQLAPGAEVSMCVPAWRTVQGWQYLGLVDELSKLGYTLKGFMHVRTPLLYAREDQIVGRQLLVLRKK